MRHPHARSLVLGVGFTPTKPLLPTHLKGLVWLDLALRATRAVVPVDCVANAARSLWDATIQSIRFWASLDADPAMASPDAYAGKDDVAVGEEYVRRSRDPVDVPYEALGEYRRRIAQGWSHPSAARVLECWQRQYATMGITTPSTERVSDLLAPTDATVARLAELGCVIDLRSVHGGTYLDVTSAGLPLRPLIDEHNRENYVLQILGALLRLAADYDRVALMYDAPTALDFRLVGRVLERAGKKVGLIEVERVETPGVAGSSRAGGWRPYTCAAICERYLGRYAPEVFRLGLRLFFVLHAPHANMSEFSYELLDRAMAKAERVARRIARSGADASRRAGPDEIASVLGGLTRRGFYERVGLVDPHAVLGLLLSDEAIRRHGAVLHTLCAPEPS